MKSLLNLSKMSTNVSFIPFFLLFYFWYDCCSFDFILPSCLIPFRNDPTSLKIKGMIFVSRFPEHLWFLPHHQFQYLINICIFIDSLIFIQNPYLTLILSWQLGHNRVDVLIMSMLTLPVNYETSLPQVYFGKQVLQREHCILTGLHNVVFLSSSGNKFLLYEPVSWPSLELLWNQNCITALILLSMIHAREKQYITKDNTRFYIKI